MMQKVFGTRRRFFLFLLVLLLTGVAVSAQETRRLSPDEAVNLAIKNNLSLESSRISATTKQRKVDTAWNVFVPNVSVSSTLTGSNAKTTSSGLAPVAPVTEISGVPPGTSVYAMAPYSVDTPQWNFIPFGLSVAWQNLNIALFEGMKTVRLDYEGGLISLEKAKAQLERDVRKTYYSMLLLQENITLLRDNLSAAERRVQTAQASYRAGLAPELTMLQAQVAMENMKPQIDQAENGLKTSMAQFAMNLGLPYDTQFELIPADNIASFIPLDVRELVSIASAGKPDIMELKNQILRLESQRKATFYQLFTPSLSVTWGMNLRLWDNVNGWGTVADAWKQSGQLSITLGFSLNGLLPFGSGQQGLKDIDDNLKSLRIGLAQSIQGTELEIYSTILNLSKVQTTVDAQKRTVDLAERTYRLTETAYRAGLQTLVEVQNAELELQKAKIGILEQQFTYLQGLIDLEYAMGVPFGTLSGSIK
jgi:outer membrane protein TolC